MCVSGRAGRSGRNVDGSSTPSELFNISLKQGTKAGAEFIPWGVRPAGNLQDVHTHSHIAFVICKLGNERNLRPILFHSGFLLVFV